jgi:hypothetical protein
MTIIDDEEFRQQKNPSKSIKILYLQLKTFSSKSMPA